jgi:hypothetical protein
MTFTKGKAFCLDVATGQLLWRSIASRGSTPVGPSSQKRRNDETAAITASG